MCIRRNDPESLAKLLGLQVLLKVGLPVLLADVFKAEGELEDGNKAEITTYSLAAEDQFWITDTLNSSTDGCYWFGGYPTNNIWGGFWHTLQGEGADFVTEVINRIAHEGTRVEGFRTEIPTLEDVFLKLTGHGIRD